MVDVAETTNMPDQTTPEQNVVVFTGETRNMAIGIAMLGGGIAAFVAGLTTTFFAEAIAWTFILWGAFFLYSDLLLATRRFVVSEDNLVISIPFRLWNREQVWAWEHVIRMDVIVKRRDTRAENATLQVYHQFPGEVAINREDRNFDPELADLVIDRAGLKADGAAAQVDLANIQLGRDAIFTWKK